MKTTIDLPDELVRQVKEVAMSRGATMRELMIDGLRSEIERRTAPGPKADFVFRSVSGNGLAPGVDEESLTQLAYDAPA